MPGMQSRPGCGDNACPDCVYWSSAPNGYVGKSFKQRQELQRSNKACDPAASTLVTGEPDAE
jgi:hypothetical protein